MKPVSSRQNPVVRTFRQLAVSPDPTGARLLLHGVHLVRDALRAGLAIELCAVAAARLESTTEEATVARELDRSGIDVLAVSDHVLEALSPVKRSSGLVAIARRVPVGPVDICSASNAFVLAAVDVQDPGNVGSLIRAAEAGGATGVLVCGASANPFSWKALRGSMGSTLRLPVAAATAVDEAFVCMRRHGLATVAAVPRGGRDPDEIDWTGRVGLLLGGEGPGLPPQIVALCDQRVTIPMAPEVESLNVAVAGGILIYAARRQRT